MEAARESNKRILSDNIKTAIFLTPALIILLIFFLIPMGLTILFSFTNLALTGAQAQQIEFVGFDNFVRMFNDNQLYDSILKTLIFVVSSGVIGQISLGFLIAFLMKGKNAIFRRFIGICVITAWVIPEIVAAFTWVAFLADSGTLNVIATSLGNIRPIAFLFQYPMISVVVANIWRGTAFCMLAFQTALDDIPKEVEEAAYMDGASRFQNIFYITIPMVKGTIATTLMLTTLSTLGVFTLIYTMTAGGPGNATMTLPVYMYQQAFVSYQLGYGTAISLVILILGAIFGFVYTKLLKVD